MYLPSHFAESDVNRLHDLIRAHPLGTLVTLGADGAPAADEVPWLLDSQAGERGTLRGHVARANPLWRTHPAGTEVLVVFKGPQAYVSPNWYATKAEHGKVVPTWNYTVVQARGRLRVVDGDTQWVRQVVDQLTDVHEAIQHRPWRTADAPPDYLSHMLQAVVGLEITLRSLTGKWKHSQNQPAANRAGVVAGLEAQNTAAAHQASRLIPP